ncbi:MAG: hypothetical protein ACI9J3_003953 [Parvicellaceae bacterium]|jgi:hypothetical protein
MRGLFLLLGSFVLIQTISYGQKNNPPIVNGSVFFLNNGDRIRGKLIKRDLDQKKVVTYAGDTVSIELSEIKKMYLPEDITLYRRKRFHYKQGGLVNASLGVSDGAVKFHVAYVKRFSNLYDIGAGLGINENYFSFHTSNGRHWISVQSMPIYALGKYYFWRHKKMWYAKGLIGYANNYNTWSTSKMKDGLMWEAAVGFTFKSRRIYKHYVELSQYSSYASGFARNFDANAISDIGFEIRFYRFMFTYGIEFGR